jgi:outer membrane receptor protein involved in Fe transport
MAGTTSIQFGFRKLAVLSSVCALALTGANFAARAADAAPARQAAAAPEEIIVTARKREESIMKAPVIIQAVSKATIDNLHIDSVQALSSVEPSLKIETGFSLIGVTVNMRGLGSGSATGTIDQQVALNLDGFTSNSGQLYRGGLFDMAQVEILKGPQALFYGKSTSGGVIAIHSADPTKTWDTKVSVGYEFNADEMDLDGYVSGPINDTLGIRIAGFHNTSKGYLINPNPANPNHRIPGGEDDGGRVTLKYDNPDIGLRVKFKGSYTSDTTNAWIGDLNESMCPPSGNPSPIVHIYDDCKVNQTTAGNPPPVAYNPAIDYANPFNPALAGGFGPTPLFKDHSYSYTKVALGILNVDYDVTPGLTVSSVTALDSLLAGEAGGSSNIVSAIGYELGSTVKEQEFSEELRLTSNWKDSWINFMVGGLYNPSTYKPRLTVAIPNLAIPFVGNLSLYDDDTQVLKSETDSAFGQISLTPIEHWELDAGVRYVHVHKHFTSLFAGGNYPSFFRADPAGEAINNVSPSLTQVTENATVPEATLSYKPTDDLTIFGTYKKGYKGPGFNISIAATSFSTASILAGKGGPFLGERVQGGEAGVKARLFDRQLSMTATGYLYSYKGLQVSYSDQRNNTSYVSNGANARIQGIELTGAYMPQSVPGLTLNAFVNYNDSHYTSYPAAPCYSGQPVTAGCTYGALATQNLAGRQLNLAPKWGGTVGGSYKWDVNDKYSMAFDASLDFSSSYYGDPSLHPFSYQSSYALLNASLRLSRSDSSWELALLCRNCTNKYYDVNANDGTNGDVTTGLISNANIDVARPRQVLLQLTVHPNLL